MAAKHNLYNVYQYDYTHNHLWGNDDYTITNESNNNVLSYDYNKYVNDSVGISNSSDENKNDTILGVDNRGNVDLIDQKFDGESENDTTLDAIAYETNYGTSDLSAFHNSGIINGNYINYIMHGEINDQIEYPLMAQQEIIDQAQYPWQTVVYITSTFSNGTTVTGSGVMVGQNDVLTASHVVYDARYGGAATNVTVTPGYDPSPLEKPFGTVDAQGWHFFTNVDPDANGLIFAGDNNATSLGGSELDVALLDLDVALGNDTGWMGLDPNFTSGDVNVTGYPAVYGRNMMNDVGFVQDDDVDWYTDISNLELHPGNSGGPIWYQGNDGPYVVGVVSTGIAACDFGGTYDTVLGWMANNDSLLAIA